MGAGTGFAGTTIRIIDSNGHVEVTVFFFD
jgi:hypothetical protein